MDIGPYWRQQNQRRIDEANRATQARIEAENAAALANAAVAQLAQARISWPVGATVCIFEPRTFGGFHDYQGIVVGYDFPPDRVPDYRLRVIVALTTTRTGHGTTGERGFYPDQLYGGAQVNTPGPEPSPWIDVD